VNIPKLRADMEYVTQNLDKVIKDKQEGIKNKGLKRKKTEIPSPEPKLVT
jgi:hypothetical protein